MSDFFEKVKLPVHADIMHACYMTNGSITGYYANLTRSVKPDTMARGTQGPICSNQ